MQQLKGVSISQGLAVGKIVVLTSAAAPEAQAGTPEEELARFQRAQQQAVRDLGALYEKARAELGEAEAEIFSVHQLMAEDEDFTDLITAAIAGGAEASEAVRQAGEQCAAMFSSMDDAYMRERAADVQDVAARIRRILRGEAETTLTGPCLIAAEELTPSQTVQFPRAFVQGFLTARGAANSHTGILARTLGVPAVSQLPVDAQLQGRTAILNGDEGTLILDPDEDQLRAAEAGIRARQAQREALQQLAKLPSVTKDGHAIRLYANLAGTDDLPLLQQSGAEGVGLLRSEFLYLGRSSYPTEDELFASYRQLVQAMDGREIIIRTLDIGADKKADYFDLPPEDNPALGLRAIRLCLTRPALLQTQLQRRRHVPHGDRPGGARAAQSRAPGRGGYPLRPRRALRPLSDRRHDRDARGRLYEPGACAGGRLLLHWHERSDAVPAGHGPAESGARAVLRPASPRCAARDRGNGAQCASGGLPCRHLRRAGRGRESDADLPAPGRGRAVRLPAPHPAPAPGHP